MHILLLLTALVVEVVYPHGAMSVHAVVPRKHLSLDSVALGCTACCVSLLDLDVSVFVAEGVVLEVVLLAAMGLAVHLVVRAIVAILKVVQCVLTCASGSVNRFDIGEALTHDDWFFDSTNLDYSYQVVMQLSTSSRLSAT